MAQTVCVIVTEAEKARLRAISEDRARPLKHILRARIILLSAERLSVLEVAHQASASRPAVWRWQQRFAEEGVDGLLHDKISLFSKSPCNTSTVGEVPALTCSEPAREVAHWTGRAVAAATGNPHARVQRIWQEHRLQPDRVRTAVLLSVDDPSTTSG